MPVLDIIEMDDSVDIVVEVAFQKPLEGKGIVQILQIVTEKMTDKVAQKLVEQVVYLEISLMDMKTRFRFMRAQYSSETEDLYRQKLHFIFYFFAVINQQIALGEVPFPDDYTNAITLPNYLD